MVGWPQRHEQTNITKTLSQILISLIPLSTFYAPQSSTSHGIKCPSYQIIGGPLCLFPVHSPRAPHLLSPPVSFFLSYSFTNYLHNFMTVEIDDTITTTGWFCWVLCHFVVLLCGCDVESAYCLN